MLRFLQVQKHKPIKLVPAGEELIRGAVVAEDFANGTVLNDTGAGDYLVDVPWNFDSMNAAIPPMQVDFEKIAEKSLVHRIPTYPGERYATTEVTAAGLTKGDKLSADGGKFVAASGTAQWVYGGPYPDPTGLPMYIVERIVPA